MKCREFERLINEQLDTREAVPAEALDALAGHQAGCPACRATALRYQALREAVASWSQNPPAPSPDFAARFPREWEHVDLAAQDASGPGIVALPWVRRAIAAAAVLMLAVWVGGRHGWQVKPAGPAGAGPGSVRPIDPDALSTALAEATSATWDLARATSAPAARVGLEVLDAATLSEPSETLALPHDVGPTTEVLESVSARVNEGVRPISGTARHAFGFLLGASGG